MLPSRVLRFRDLRKMGVVQNWPTLARWIEKEGFPSGRLLGPNSRCWTEEEVEAWFLSRPEHREDPPPEKAKPAPSAATEEGGSVMASAGNQSNSTNKRNGAVGQAASDPEVA
jgi:predicted DNA-binding transcriptional regulator AlpA